MNDAAMNILVGVVIAAASSWITVQLSLRRFRSERWWERRVAGYERVIEALHHSKAFSRAHLAAVEEGRDLTKEQDRHLRLRYDEALLEIERATDVGGFVLSDEAQARLGQYRKEAGKAADTQEWHGHLEAHFAATQSCLSDLIRIAKKDLQTR